MVHLVASWNITYLIARNHEDLIQPRYTKFEAFVLPSAHNEELHVSTQPILLSEKEKKRNLFYQAWLFKGETFSPSDVILLVSKTEMILLVALASVIIQSKLFSVSKLGSRPVLTPASSKRYQKVQFLKITASSII